MIKTALKLVTLSLTIVSSLSYATDAVSHYNAHTTSGAETLYELWKSNKSDDNDPFYRIAAGYAYDKETDTSDFYEADVSTNESAYISTETDNIETSMSDRITLWEESVESAYEEATSGSDDEFDYDIYETAMDDYLEARETEAGLYYESRQENIAEVSSTTYSGVLDINTDVLTNSADATENIVNLILDDMSKTKESIYDGFEDNIDNASSATEYAESALELAYAFSDDCSACDFDLDDVNDLAEIEDVDDIETTTEIVDECDYSSIYGYSSGSSSYLYYMCP